MNLAEAQSEKNNDFELLIRHHKTCQREAQEYYDVCSSTITDCQQPSQVCTAVTG